MFFFQSKLFMFDAWYNKILTTGLRFDLCMTDTDSFLFKVSSAKKFFRYFRAVMDFSNYPQTHPSYSEDHKQMLGFFKDEFAGKQKCLEFIGLRSKCYSLKLIDLLDNVKLSDKKVCKGLGKTAIKNDLKFEHYKNCLFENQLMRNQFFAIRSQKHQLKTVLINKLALSYIDTKRWLYPCSLHSVPYGSYQIRKYFDECPICNKIKTM